MPATLSRKAASIGSSPAGTRLLKELFRALATNAKIRGESLIVQSNGSFNDVAIKTAAIA
ncbi:hypothetical protein IQ250_00360 [Pseudanabaenaceae cyanobacterium LEGE 13415]|nr:hypothetical protein [Pseudanabaenaceae cyanobacterium LEGE 13415]